MSSHCYSIISSGAANQTVLQTALYKNICLRVTWEFSRPVCVSPRLWSHCTSNTSLLQQNTVCMPLHTSHENEGICVDNKDPLQWGFSKS